MLVFKLVSYISENSLPCTQNEDQCLQVGRKENSFTEFSASLDKGSLLLVLCRPFSSLVHVRPINVSSTMYDFV